MNEQDEQERRNLINSFDLEGLILILEKYDFKRICLQFIDEYLTISVDIYLFLQSNVKLKAEEEVEFYLIADSTWGTSVDDISAAHVTSDLLVYFGSDLSSSSSLPTIIMIPARTLHLPHAIDSINRSLTSAIDFTNEKKSIVLLYEPGYSWAMGLLWFSLHLPSSSSILIGQLPLAANLDQWVPHRASSKLEKVLTIGGLLLPASAFNEENDLHDHTVVVYIGNKTEQLEKLLLRCNHIPIHHYQPEENLIVVKKGNESSVLRERYGGIEKVKKAKIVGLLIGSMGYEAALTNEIIHRLEKLIVAAGKSFYTFVMGRINEAKLCNFPEVDLYCLIANEDIAVIKPKSFPVSVITPYELELGLGAREWSSKIVTNIGEILADDLIEATRRVEEAKQLNEYYNEEEDGKNHGQEIIRLDQLDGHNVHQQHQQLIVFESAANDFFQSRNYRGLIEFAEKDESTVIHSGQVGIAANYQQISLSSTPSQPLQDIEDMIVS